MDKELRPEMVMAGAKVLVSWIENEDSDISECVREIWKAMTTAESAQSPQQQGGQSHE